MSSSQAADIANPSVTNNTRQGNVETDIALLSALLTKFPADAESVDEKDIAELLRQMETADGIARGMESRLDNLIDHLNSLLHSLEEEGGVKPQESQQDVVVVEQETIIVEVTENTTVGNH
ncbi:hypothetical protein ABKN59_003148 [Abortiporus biennis]